MALLCDYYVEKDGIVIAASLRELFERGRRGLLVDSEENSAGVVEFTLEADDVCCPRCGERMCSNGTAERTAVLKFSSISKEWTG